MKILVLSDTHIPLAAKSLPAVIKKEAQASDCCLHAGDFVSYEVFETLCAWTKVYGVCGNMDNADVRHYLPSQQVLRFEEVTVGLTHGRGGPATIVPAVGQEFQKQFETIDIFVFGHSHAPLDREIDGKIYFNPGSPTDTVFTPYRSYGILEIIGACVKRRLVRFE